MSRRALSRRTGPSAGVTIATAIVSLVSGRTVSEDVAMTGEITLTGQVLPIGGVREKVLAAKRAGLTTVIVPKENEPDLDELPREAKEQMRFVVAEHIEQVLAEALDGAAAAPLAAAGAERRAAAPR